MISIERALLGAGFSGDALERHKEYGQRAGHLDVIVMTTKRFNKRKVNSYLTIYPTNSMTKLNYIFDAFKIARRLECDLVVCQDPFLNGLAGWLVKKWFKVPLLVHFHGDFWQNRYWLLEKGRWWFNWFFLILSKFVVKGADGIRVTSSGIKDKLVSGGVKKEKIRVIPTPIDLERFEDFDQEEVGKIKGKYPNKIVVNVGRKDPAKDFKVLFKTMDLVREKYRNIEFLQIGAGFSLGEMNRESLANYYHAANIYLSSSKHESFGKVLVEAMAAGLPVVATKTTGSKEIIKDGVNGYLVPIGDSQALARKVLYLLNNPEKAKEMGKAGKKIVEKKFNQEKIMGKIIKLWKELV